MKIFGLDGKKGLKNPKTTKCIVSSTVDVFIVKRNASIKLERSNS